MKRLVSAGFLRLFLVCRPSRKEELIMIMTRKEKEVTMKTSIKANYFGGINFEHDRIWIYS